MKSVGDCRRAGAAARQESEAEDEWDKPLDCTGLAERFNAARERVEREEVIDWSSRPPIFIPYGKENTVRGRLAARINAARERMRRISAITLDTLLKLVGGQVIHELGEDSLYCIHPSLSAIRAGGDRSGFAAVD